MSIKGFIRTSFLDFQGKVASVVFLSGCNFRCNYCHNKELVVSHSGLKEIPENEVWGWIKANRGFIDGIVLSGGEPCLDNNLTHYLTIAKTIGLKTKIFSNGMYPRTLEYCFKEGLVDFVSLDIKARINELKYSKVAGIKVDICLLNRSIDLLMSEPGRYEFRTTVYRSTRHQTLPGVGLSDIKNILSRVNGADKYIIQNFRSVDDSPKYLKPYDYETLAAMKFLAEKHVKEVTMIGGPE